MAMKSVKQIPSCHIYVNVQSPRYADGGSVRPLSPPSVSACRSKTSCLGQRQQKCDLGDDRVGRFIRGASGVEQPSTLALLLPTVAFGTTHSVRSLQIWSVLTKYCFVIKIICENNLQVLLYLLMFLRLVCKSNFTLVDTKHIVKNEKIVDIYYSYTR
ncbi:uncharacterized protein LOC121868827 isoform X1 [Homarus americanus]|uniref:uncharacterized protein LOC121868827 isoform X1 n=1 Tax=Homarus americanus TaxID=6706 RepID=UPI001C44A5EF|nr:uncharacterized protein LOC121868827 isoform X1 [Homarus americanus]